MTDAPAPSVAAWAAAELKRRRWQRADLAHLLDPVQQEINAKLDSFRGQHRKVFLLASRRLGKTTIYVVRAWMRSLAERRRVLFLAPWGKSAADVVNEVSQRIFDDCPDEMRPHYDPQRKEYRFPNGSLIAFKGTNGEHARDLRGGAWDDVILDEAGEMDDLDYVIKDIVLPMVMTTDGMIWIATTPPRSPGHPSARLYEECAGDGAAMKLTLLDNKRIPNDRKIEFLMESGESREHAEKVIATGCLPQGTTALREYFCEFVTDAETAVVPEFTAQARDEIVRETPRPPFFDAYVGMDTGIKDRTGILYAIFDFNRGKTVIEDESLLHGHAANTENLADELRAKELALWGEREPYRRVTDIELRLMADLNGRYGLRFIPADKKDSDGAIRAMRSAISAREIEIHPRCKHLIRQLRDATWSRQGSDFAHEAGGGHFDLVAALKYLLRKVDRFKNPYPEGYAVRRTQDHHVPMQRQMQDRKTGSALMVDSPFARLLSAARKPFRG